MRIRFSEDAQAFVRREAHYLRSHSQAAARRFLDRLKEARRNLVLFPHMGLETAVHGGRQLVIGDYVLIYDVTDDMIAVLSIRHGRMMPHEIDSVDDLDYEAPGDAS